MMWKSVILSCVGVGLFSMPAANAVEVMYDFSGTFVEGGTFSGSFSYDTAAESQSLSENIGSFDVPEFEVFVNDELFLTDEDAQGTIARYSFTDIVTLEFGATVGIPEAPPPTGFLLELTGVGGDVDELPVFLGTETVDIVGGFATSPSFSGSIVPDATSITLVVEALPDSSASVPEPSAVIGLVLVGLGAYRRRTQR